MEFFKSTTNFDFLGLRYVSLGISAVLVLCSIGLIATKGLNYGLDFTGGTLIEVKFEEPIEIAEVRAKLTEAGYHSPVVQGLGNTREVAIRIAPHSGQGTSDTAEEAAAGEASQKLADAVMAVLTKDGRKATAKPPDFVGPQVGKELRESGMVAVIIVALGIMLYIWARFEWRFGAAAIVSEIHDTILTVGFLSLIGYEFDLTVLAAVLSVVGYSINDKVVVFDRIREIFRAGRKLEPIEVLNRAINGTLSRTIMTSVTTSLAVGSLWLIGSPSVAGFGLTMIVGIVIGTLSSIFFASPVLLYLGVSKRDLMPKIRDQSDLDRRP